MATYVRPTRWLQTKEILFLSWIVSMTLLCILLGALGFDKTSYRFDGWISSHRWTRKYWVK